MATWSGKDDLSSGGVHDRDPCSDLPAHAGVVGVAVTAPGSAEAPVRHPVPGAALPDLDVRGIAAGGRRPDDRVPTRVSRGRQAVITSGWVFPVTDRLGRLVTARVTVNAADLIVITSPDGSMFGVNVTDQFEQFAAALRQAKGISARATGAKRTMDTKAASTMTQELTWRKSAWDNQVHAFRFLGEVVSEAICSHSCLTSRLTEPSDKDRRCQGCLMIHGTEVECETRRS
jgi:hypothetical protein